MPMIDAFVPDGALRPDAEARMIKEITDKLIELEGLDPGSERIQAVSVVYLHRPRVFVGGAAAAEPRYRFIPSVPEGQYTELARAGVVREITAAVARAEGKPFDQVAPRVWVFPNEVTDGRWGGRGIIRRLPDIIAFLAGTEAGEAARERLARRRREAAAATLRALVATSGE